jgi:hypothetical protein
VFIPRKVARSLRAFSTLFEKVDPLCFLAAEPMTSWPRTWKLSIVGIEVLHGARSRGVHRLDEKGDVECEGGFQLLLHERAVARDGCDSASARTNEETSWPRDFARCASICRCKAAIAYVPAAHVDSPQKGDESRHRSRGAYSFTGAVRWQSSKRFPQGFSKKAA